MASDNLAAAGISGGLEAIQDVLGSYVNFKLASKLQEQKDYLQAEDVPEQIRMDMGAKPGQRIRKDVLGLYQPQLVYNPDKKTYESISPFRAKVSGGPGKSAIGDMNSGQQNAAFKLADDYEKASGEFQKVTGSYNRVRASGKEPSAAGDLALIFNYMKMLDPGSVVREGEFATAQNSGSVPDIVRAKYNQVLKGERLSDGIRVDFMDRAKRLYDTGLTQQRIVDKQYSSRAQQYGIDPKLVVRDMAVFEEPTVDPQPKKKVAKEPTAPTPNGGVPQVGQIFNGAKVTKVTRVK